MPSKERKLAKKNIRILIIDDEESIRDGCQQILTRQGYEPTATADGMTGLELARTGAFDVILLDLRMPRIEGLEILRILKSEHPVASKIIVITGYGTIPVAVEAMRLGAHNFITKPFSAAELKLAVQDCLSEKSEERPTGDSLSMIIGTSDYVEELKETIRRVAKTDSTVLITGESGTGKELVARTIHSLSARSNKPFVPVDCSSLVHNLMESELFGHIKGAFSGATENRDGRFQTADKGTLFLDEISNISLDVQAKLLRVIQEQEVPRVGSSIPEKIDVRLITATNKDLRVEVQNGTFREDLFYRISVVPIHIKPLREHRSDIAPIAFHYFDIFRSRHGSKAQSLSPEVVKSLTSYTWPGNIRELKNTIERLCVLCDHEEVTLSDILYYGQDTCSKAPVVDPFSGKMTLVEVEKEHIEKALHHFNNQINKTARFLGIDRKTLRTKIRNYGIEIKDDE
ncbi:Transcriptional regulatory protein ZraR [anaerobic digester metagenome]|jgi:DNA-binding NtrC family response regulator|uniref:Transcriptional regulatory protein ZraR n=1 Tax=anaerobic digester metagenome TaxID=1263854 RepID=A0A485M2C4_9ZZZZ